MRSLGRSILAAGLVGSPVNSQAAGKCDDAEQEFSFWTGVRVDGSTLTYWYPHALLPSCHREAYVLSKSARQLSSRARNYS
jgi:hypothetical protein